MTLIKIDGSLGHGGGQIFRSALALSAALGIPFEMDNIRAARRQPGLRRQHLCGLKAAGELCGARVEGDELGSTRVVFEPGKLRGGRYDFAVSTGGSTALILQSVLIPMALASGSCMAEVKGGTYCSFAPTGEFFIETLVPRLKEMGYRISAEMREPGFQTAGGGRISVCTEKAEAFKAVDWTRKEPLKCCHIEVLGCRIPPDTLMKIASLIRKQIALMAKPIEYSLEIRPDVVAEGSGGAVIVRLKNGKYVTVISEIAAYGYSSERLAHQIGKSIRSFLAHGAPIETHLADQILIPMLFAGGGKFLAEEISDHFQSCTNLIRAFTGLDITLTKSDKNVLVEVPKLTRKETRQA